MDRPSSVKPALPRSFYARPVLQVARDLIGRLLVRRVNGRQLVGRIIETEAYGGGGDPASHAFRGQTPRCRTMFGPPGHCYVYFTYGSHYCANVTASDGRLASAVLLRAVAPIDGHALLRKHRAARTASAARAASLRDGDADGELCNGPGKLAAAFALDADHDGLDLTAAHTLWIAAGQRARRVLWTPRIGLGCNPAADWLWRCVDARAPGVSRIPGHWPRASRPTPAARCGTRSPAAASR